jgi:hypothetical protein
MTRDIFNPPVGTLDVIVYMVLRSLGFSTVENFTGVLHPSDTDGRCKRNAERFAQHFAGQKIRAIKQIREVSGLGLRDAKEAYEQVVETYIGTEQHYRMLASQALEDGRYGDVEFYVSQAREAARY